MITKKDKIGIPIFIVLMLTLGIYLGDNYTWTLSMAHVFLLIGLLIWVGIKFLAEICHNVTEHVIWNMGHGTIRKKDIIPVSWQENSNETEGEIRHNNMTVMLTGGIDTGWAMVTLPGKTISPVLIFPSIYLNQELHDYHSFATLTYTPFDELPSYLRHELMSINLLPESRNRIDPIKTPFWYGTTSHLDGSCTPKNLRIERERKHENREVAEMEKRENRFYERDRKDKDSKRKEYLAVREQLKPIKEVD